MHKNSVAQGQSITYAIITMDLSLDIVPRGPVVFLNNQCSNN